MNYILKTKVLKVTKMLRSKEYDMNLSERDVLSDISIICKELEQYDLYNAPFIYCGENIGKMIEFYNIRKQIYFIIAKYDNGKKKNIGYFKNYRSNIIYKLNPNSIIISNDYKEFNSYFNKMERKEKLQKIQKYEL